MFHLLNTVAFLTLFFPIVAPLSFNITNFRDESASIVSYVGDANVSNGSIVLTTLNTNRMGRAIYGQPMRLKNTSEGVVIVAHFSTRFSFTIDVSTTSNYGDGFAFYIASPGYPIPASAGGGGGLGIYSGNDINVSMPQNNIVAVEFDTFANTQPDPTMRHVGININSAVSLAYSSFDIESNIGKKCDVWITYNASTKTLAVSWFFEGSSSVSRPNTSLSHQIDLGEFMSEWVTVGFSGANGLSEEQNVIHSWEFTSTLNSTIPEANRETNNCLVNEKHSNFNVLVVTLACSVAFVFVVVSITVSWLITKKRRKEKTLQDLDRAGIPRRFDYKELAAATNEFADDRRLGEGGSGQVYKGVLSDLGQVVAVKRIFSDVENSEEIFKNEVKIISRLIHRNLVKFIGWCHEQGELLLVFEYMSNGSMDTHLFGSKKTLAWDVRYKIALGVAKALLYLHEDAEQCVLHRDIKSANVLLDTDFSTKLSDFGMAKLIDPRLRTQRTRVVGTYGYLAPEYRTEGRASKESDVYSFGVVALEIACGKRTHQDREHNHVPLMNWVWKHYAEGNILNAADERLNKDFDVDEMTCLLTVGLWCTLLDHKKRPKAEQVIIVLKQEAPLPILSMEHA